MNNLIQILFAIGGIQSVVLATLFCLDKTDAATNKLLVLLVCYFCLKISARAGIIFGYNELNL
ncbi:hypothetical protein B1199_13655 [Pseudoalteromonas ulvae]|uniref:Uncharacterized protein n=1 Tax=Pseudoalteromonas ulvae TaxID=107327 RepID=A0A244CNM3_PSEDV|nr:hypothetical protein B1199_13655 [Pseudoalteromonas ulvae]